MNTMLKIKRLGLLLGTTLLALNVYQSPAGAEPPERSLSNEELSRLTLRLQQELGELKKFVQEQNEIIHVLKGRVEAQGGKPIAIPPPAGGEVPKPKTLRQNLKHYLLEKPESLPPKDERLPVTAGMGAVNLDLLLQEWYTIDDHAKDNFRHRRLELGFGGRLTDHLKWKLQIDPSLVLEDNTTRSILKDAYFSFDGIPHHEIKLGQYKIPITEEGFRSSALIDTIERSFMGRTFGDKRDMGLMAVGNWKYLNYQIGVFNGDEANRFDTNDQKDIAARFVLRPFPDSNLLKGFEGGSSMYFRATNDSAAEKKRIGAELRYAYGPLSLKSEYVKAQDAGVPANGWYVQAGYFFLPRWQGIFRFEGFDPSERISNDKEFDATAGINYFLVYPTTKLQVNYVHKDAQSNGTTDNQIIGAVQYGF